MNVSNLFPDPNELLDLRRENARLKRNAACAAVFLRYLHQILTERGSTIAVALLELQCPESAEPLPAAITGPLKLAETVAKECR